MTSFHGVAVHVPVFRQGYAGAEDNAIPRYRNWGFRLVWIVLDY